MAAPEGGLGRSGGAVGAPSARPSAPRRCLQPIRATAPLLAWRGALGHSRGRLAAAGGDNDCRLSGGAGPVLTVCLALPPHHHHTPAGTPRLSVNGVPIPKGAQVFGARSDAEVEVYRRAAIKAGMIEDKTFAIVRGAYAMD